ncbi:hypothetical protein BH10CHL1_BH10CHL1_50660 [soil metagenome]
MSADKIVIPLEISEISTDILPVVCRFFPPQTAELTLVAVARPLTEFVAQSSEPTSASPVGQTRLNQRSEWDAYRRGLEERLMREARHLRETGYRVHTNLLTGDTVHEIFTFIKQGDFNLVAMATHGREGLSRQVFGSMAEHIAHLVSVPMLMVTPSATETAALKRAESSVSFLNAAPQPIIAIATDGSQHTQQAGLVAANLTKALNAELKVLVTVSARPGAAYDQEVMSSIQTLLHKQPVQPELIPLVGPTDEVLGRYLAEHPVDLLVLGAFKDRSAGSPATIGITAQRVAQQAPMSVLMVKEQQATIRRMLVNIAVGDAYLIDSALQLAKALWAEVHFLHVLAAQSDITPQRVQETDPAFDHLLTQDPHLSDFLQSTIKTLETGGMDRSMLAIWRGDVLKTILNLTQPGHYDLILVGNHSSPRFFRDTIANAVLSYATTSVLVVRLRPGASKKYLVSRGQ